MKKKTTCMTFCCCCFHTFVLFTSQRTNAHTHTCEGYMSYFMLFSISDDFIVLFVCLYVCPCARVCGIDFNEKQHAYRHLFIDLRICIRKFFVVTIFISESYMCQRERPAARVRAIHHINLNLTFFPMQEKQKSPITLPVAE